MQIKMRKNSVFARLLRSPWWVSLLIGVAISLAIPALFASRFAHFGVFIALPFFGIGLLRAYRQLHETSAGDMRLTEQAIRGMSPREFSAILTSAYTETGYVVTPASGKAADLKLENDGRVTLVSCRRIKAANTGVEPLHSLVASGQTQNAARLIYLTLGELSAEAQDYAAEHGIEVLGLETLASILAKRVKAAQRKQAG
jgi:restriction system protein